MKTHNIVYPLLLSIIICSCSLYPPISETIIFNENLELNNSDDIVNVTALARTSISNSFISSNIPNKYLEENKNIEVGSRSMNKLWQFGLSGWGILFRVNDNFFLGINPNLFFNAGIDFTLEMFDGIYLTAEGTAVKNYELIFQKRIFNDFNFKNTIGIVYRRDKFGFIENSLNNKAETFFLNSIGFRTLNYWKLFEKGVVVELSFLYELKYKTSIVNFGLSYNISNIF
jgi:hypothetical protein